MNSFAFQVMILQGIMPNASNLVRSAGSTPCMSSMPRCCQSSPRKHFTKPCVSLFSPSPQRLLLLVYAYVYANACLCGRSVGIAVGAGHRDLSTRGVGFPGSEDLHAILGDKERVLYNIISDLSMPPIFTRYHSPNCAVLLPSIVVLVQLSGQVMSRYLPRAIMGSMVKVMPGLHSPTCLFLA